MKKYLALLCASVLCVCCLGLAACGGGGSSSAAASGSASASSASASSSSASAATNYAGDWKFAGMKANMGTGEITMVGDLDTMASAFGTSSSSMQFGLTLKEDGTGSLVSGDSTYPVTWTENAKGITLKDASGASASAASASASAASAGATAAFGGTGSVDLVYNDGVFEMPMEQDGQTATIFFSKDGKLPGATEITTANAKPITSEADLVGNWKFTGMSMMGLSIYGSADALNSLSGGSGVDMNISFEAGGKGTLGGSEFTYTVDSSGAKMVSGGATVPISSLDGSLMIDMTDILGMSVVMVFSK